MKPENLDSHLYDRERSPACVTQTLSIQGPAGALEAILTCPENKHADRVGVICHPHPLYGGTMHNKVVHYVARTLNQLGMPTVQFNFRGAGNSEGEYADGIGETDDLIAVLEHVQRIYPGREVWLAGFSFGAYVALRASTQWPVEKLVTVAPPVNFFDFSALSLPDCPWLLVQGDQDEVVPCGEVLAWSDQLDEPPQTVCLKGVGHFFHGRLNDLRAVLLDKLLAPALKKAVV